MSSNEFPTYAALGDSNAQKQNQQTLIEKFTSWFRNFLENAEWELKSLFIVNFKIGISIFPPPHTFGRMNFILSSVE